MRDNFESGPSDVVERYFLSRAIVALLLCIAGPFVQFGREHYEEQFCENILNMEFEFEWSRRRIIVI